MADFKNRFKEAAKETGNGCPLFDGRDKGDWDTVEGETLTLERAHPMTGKKGIYYVVWFTEHEDEFFQSPYVLTEILDKGRAIAEEENVSIDEVISGLQIKVGPEKRTNGGNKYRSMEVVG